MTHCSGYRGSAVARAGDVRSLGIDAEEHAPLPPDVLDAVALPGEREHVYRLNAARREVHWDRLLFSAKESVYKAWFPLTRRWLGFEDVEVTAHPAATSFSARLLRCAPQLNWSPNDGFKGRWLVQDGLMLTAVVVPAPLWGAAPDTARRAAPASVDS
jgi:4'-phosphopantetheinyl transferase EntD